MQDSSLNKKRKKRNIIIAAIVGAVSLGALGLTIGSITLANRKSATLEKKTIDNYYSEFGKLEADFYNTQVNDFKNKIQESKNLQLNLIENEQETWNTENTYKSKFNELSTLIEKILNEVQDKELKKNVADKKAKEKVNANIKAYRDYFVSQLNQIEDILNSEESQKDFVKSKINNLNSKENYEDLVYYQIKAFKLGELWQKAAAIKEDEAKKAGNDEEKKKAVNEKFKKLDALLSGEEKRAIDNLKEIQEEVNKIIENENDKFKTTPEDELAFKMDEFLEIENKINGELIKKTEFQVRITSLTKSINDNSIDIEKGKKEKESIENELRANLLEIETLIKKYKAVLNEIKELINQTKQFKLYKNNFDFTIHTVDWIKYYFENFKKEYDRSTEQDYYNVGLTELTENTNEHFTQIANIK